MLFLSMSQPYFLFFFFFFNDTATTEIYTLSLHDALPISMGVAASVLAVLLTACKLDKLISKPPSTAALTVAPGQDRKSTRLNSSHSQISYAVFCLKKKKHNRTTDPSQSLEPNEHLSTPLS